MLETIKVKNFGAIKEEVSIDFLYKNYQNKNDDEGIDIDKQVIIDEKTSVIKVLLGKNATGKSSFMEPVLFFQEFVSGYETNWSNNFINSVNQYASTHDLEYDNTSSVHFSSYIAKDLKLNVNSVDLSFTISPKFMNILGSEAEPIISGLVKEAVVASMPRTEREKFLKIKAKGEDEFKFSVVNGDIVKSWNNSSMNLSTNIISNTKFSVIPNQQGGITVKINGPFMSVITDFFSNINNNIISISLNAREKINTARNTSILNFGSYTINDEILQLVKKTNQKFVMKLLKTIDPYIISIQREPTKNAFIKGRVLIGLKNESLPIAADELSSGTKHFISVFNQILNALSSGKLVMIDELDNGLQIRMAKLLLDLFVDEDINRKKSQILFTTHSLNYMKFKYVSPKNHIIAYRDKNGVIKFAPYSEILLNNGIRQELHSSIDKVYFDEKAFKDPIYPFMMTRSEKNLLIKDIPEFIK